MRRAPTLLLAAWVLLAPLAPSLRAGVNRRIGKLHFVDVPQEPLKASWRRARLELQDLEPTGMLATIRSIGPLGTAVLEAVERSDYHSILVAFLDRNGLPSEVHQEMAAIGFEQRTVSFSHTTLGGWNQSGPFGLVILRVDRIAAARNDGNAATPAGVLAHELVHAAQTTWGSLSRSGGTERYHDAWDEAEAWLVGSLVDRAGLLSRPVAIVRRGESALLGSSLQPGRAALATLVEKVIRRTYRGISLTQSFDPERHDPARDPFARLPP